jgi:hypothetical protein
MWVQSFTLPPSKVKDWHPEAKTDEFYASCQNKKNEEEFWLLGPFQSREEARVAVCEEAVRRENKDWIRSTVKIVDERDYWLNETANRILAALDSHTSDEDAKLCFDWAINQRANANRANQEDKGARG